MCGDSRVLSLTTLSSASRNLLDRQKSREDKSSRKRKLRFIVRDESAREREESGVRRGGTEEEEGWEVSEGTGRRWLKGSVEKVGKQGAGGERQGRGED